MPENKISPNSNLSSSTHVPFVNLALQHEPIREELQEAVARVFRTNAFVLGEEVAQFERDFANYCDSRFAVGCASGTDALILSLMALGIGPGDEVITTPFSFFATASCIARIGATPVFADIDPSTFNLDPESVEERLTDKTRAIIPVHLFGQCAEMEPLWRIAVRHGLAIVEDACQAVGAEYRGRRAGVLGLLGCFSFFPTKNLGGVGDGGAVTTDDPDLAERLRRLRVHGDLGGYRHVEIGINSRLDALQAAVLDVKLRYLDQWTAARQQNAKRYNELFREYGLLDVIELPEIGPERRHVFNQYCVRVKGGFRDELKRELAARGIHTAIYYPAPLHLQKCFQYLGYKQGDLPEAERAANEILALPVFPGLTVQQQETLVAATADIVKQLMQKRVRAAA